MIDTIEGKFCKGEIFIDSDPESPREWDNLGKIVSWHRSYTFGDTPSQDPREWMNEHSKEYPVIIPLFLYDHSGISLSTRSFIGRAHHADWDSGQVGFIYETRESILESFQVKKITAKVMNRVRDYLENEVKVYDQYLRGDVYGYKITRLNGDDIPGTFDSCWGFYGLEYAKEECKVALEEADHDIQEENNHLESRLVIACAHAEC